MQIEVVTPDALGRAEAVLCRGFPYRPPGFWRGVLGALSAYRKARGAGPIGTLLVDKGEDVGVLLTLDSPTGGGVAGTRKLNLSSWYVDQRARFWAPLMLRAALGARGLVTDLSPTREVEAVNERLGLARRVRGSMIVPMPLDSFRPSSARLSTDQEGELLRDHHAMGMLCAGLATVDGRRLPLIFLRTRLRGLPGARLIYCESLSLLRRHRGAIARFLVARGLLFLEIEANRAETWPGALHAATRCRVFAKGELPADAIDHSYTELTFLHQNAARPA